MDGCVYDLRCMVADDIKLVKPCASIYNNCIKTPTFAPGGKNGYTGPGIGEGRGQWGALFQVRRLRMWLDDDAMYMGTAVS